MLASTQNELARHLIAHFADPQPSERWAMYRIITPVVDYAIRNLPLHAYFEYNQTSPHGTHQSVDIGLLNTSLSPAVLVEAKGLSRSVSPEQIDKYLGNSTRGVVTNGAIWVVCYRQRHRAITLYEHGNLNRDALKEITSFVGCEAVVTRTWSANPQFYRSTTTPKEVSKSIKAKRTVHPKNVLATESEVKDFAASLDRATPNEMVLLETLSETLSKTNVPAHFRVEARKTRVSFFDERISDRRKRVARIELGKNQPDVLVLTSICQNNPALGQIAAATVHVKGDHMRRIRLKDERQTREFGAMLFRILIDERESEVGT